MRLTRFAKLAWSAVAVNLAVILWGAVVRATGSGAGCGNNWPRCNGEVVPLSGSTEQFIEFVHRLTSGAALVLIGVLVVAAFRTYPARHRVRRAAVWSGIFILTEALLGAGLVLFEQVADNADTSRGFWISGHFANTTLLLGALTLTAWWASGGAAIDRRAPRSDRRLIGFGVAGMLVIGVSGAIAALGDTLFPAEDFFSGFRRELSGSAHLFERLRVFHPFIAIGVGVFMLYLARRFFDRSATAARLSTILTTLVSVQFMAGFVNVALAAPTWLQIIHLLIADLVWIAFVILAAEVLSVPATVAAGTGGSESLSDRAGGRVR